MWGSPRRSLLCAPPPARFLRPAHARPLRCSEMRLRAANPLLGSVDAFADAVVLSCVLSSFGSLPFPANVRGIVLHSELKEIAITGSWDATIRIWNVETAECLKVLADHHADVYGLAMHPQRPFALASSSRDTTLRFWTLGMLAPSLPLRAAFGLPFTRTQAGPEAAAPHTGFLVRAPRPRLRGTQPRLLPAAVLRSSKERPPHFVPVLTRANNLAHHIPLSPLCHRCSQEGQASAALAQALLDGRSELDKGALISAFFGCGAGMERLWELARIIDVRASPLCMRALHESPTPLSALKRFACLRSANH